MAKICISGFTASGKTTIAEQVSRSLNIPHIHKSYKEYVKSELEVADFTAKASDEFVKGFDNEVVQMAQSHESCVLSTWLAPWMIKDATLKVWLDASLEERARRWSRIYNKGFEEAKRMVNDKDQSEIASIKRIYGIDLNDRSIFDIIINTEAIGINEAAEIVCIAAKASKKP